MTLDSGKHGQHEDECYDELHSEALDGIHVRIESGRSKWSSIARRCKSLENARPVIDPQHWAITNKIALRDWPCAWPACQRSRPGWCGYHWRDVVTDHPDDRCHVEPESEGLVGDTWTVVRSAGDDRPTADVHQEQGSQKLGHHRPPEMRTLEFGSTRVHCSEYCENSWIHQKYISKFTLQ